MAIIVSECPGEFRSSKLGKVATNKKGQVISQFTCTYTLPLCKVLSSPSSPYFFSFLVFSFLLLLSPFHSIPLLTSLLLFSILYAQITIDTLANLRLRLNVTKDRYRMSQVSQKEVCERSVISLHVNLFFRIVQQCYSIV
jgi:hypothetical protein